VSKRGDKRRKRARQRPIRIDVEGFQYGPLTVERHGRHLFSHLDAEHPDYPAFKDLVEAERAAVPGRIQQLREEVRALCAPYDAFDVLAGLWMVNIARDPETFRESTDKGLIAAVELAAAILIERDGRVPTRAAEAPDLAVATEVNERLVQLLQLQGAQFMIEAMDDTDDDLAEIRAEARAHRLMVRGPSYPWQERNTLIDLFSGDGGADIVERAVGFSIENALALADAAETLGLTHYAERAAQARGFADEFKAQYEQAREGNPVADRWVESVSRLDVAGHRQSIRAIDGVSLKWLHASMGDTMQFTVSELAQASEVSLEVAGAFLDRLSLDFGQFADRDWPPDIEDVRERPFVHDGRGHYFCVSPASLLWTLRPTLERAIKELPGDAFKRWDRHRARVVEDRAVKALSTALGADWCHTGLYYETVEVGKRKRPELDGILRVDTCAVLVEAKASSMRPSARRGAPAALRSWIKNELSKASDQARRTRNTILGDVPANVTDGHNKPVALDVNGVSRTYEILVVLEDLPGIAPLTWQMGDLGLLPAEPTPLVLHLHDLELICEMAERPAQLIHYFERRRRLDRQRRAWAHDELDYFMNYLGQDGLFWPDIPTDEAKISPIRLLSFTDELDTYFAHKEGQRRRRAKRPRQRLHRDVRALLDHFDDVDEPGWLEAQIVLLELDEPSAARIASSLRRLKTLAERDGVVRDASFMFPDGDFGVTVMAVPTSLSGELSRRLVAYCTLKKHQMRYARWYGYGCHAVAKGLVQTTAILDRPWTPDENLDGLVESLPSARAEGGNFDGTHQRAEIMRRRRRDAAR